MTIDLLAIIFDRSGRKILRRPSKRVTRLGEGLEGLDRLDHAVRKFGHIYIKLIRGGLIVEFDPRVAGRLAVIAAFYEISDRAPEKVVLACRGAVRRFEIWYSPGQACRRIEELLRE